ncbi:PEGA domain-containing protein [Alcaligenes faecalis]|uniref:PEGA domain-containing protein n=1 Tax=Alcaligenes faecalis TaxID=511 RepID=UPI00208F97D2|nr:PEGA domain-containing protein [Alcaligenes faecalis]USP49557.1 PEGA domain-containing protein [Alcaligenes faecalis]
MNCIKVLLVLCFFLFLGACSSIAVTYHSDPEGATVVCNGSVYGETPLTIHYKLRDVDKHLGILYTDPCYAQWLSGYGVSYTNRVHLPPIPVFGYQMAKRPLGDGYAQDADYGLRVQTLRQMREQQEENRRLMQAQLREQRKTNCLLEGKSKC